MWLRTQKARSKILYLLKALKFMNKSSQRLFQIKIMMIQDFFEAKRLRLKMLSTSTLIRLFSKDTRLSWSYLRLSDQETTSHERKSWTFKNPFNKSPSKLPIDMQIVNILVVFRILLDMRLRLRNRRSPLVLTNKELREPEVYTLSRLRSVSVITYVR